MLKKIALLAVLTFAGCQTQKTKIKNETYKVSSSIIELGSIGLSKSALNLNTFDIKALPKLENNIRIGINVVPFYRKLNKIYTSKAKYNQNLTKVAFVDSLPVKPEIVTIKVLDIAGLVQEINADYNSEILNLLINTQDYKIITSLAVNLSPEEITKIKQSDAYYLSNAQHKKNVILLYKSGKKTETIDINPQTILAYQLSTFCWQNSERAKWYVADIVHESINCSGTTKNKISKKKELKNLFDM